MSAWAEMRTVGPPASEEADRFADRVEQALRECAERVGGGAAELAPVASGFLAKSLGQTGVDRHSDTLMDAWIGVPATSTGKPYWVFVEKGTKPIPAPGPPIGDGTPGSGLLRWVREKKMVVVNVTRGKHAGKVARRLGGLEGGRHSVGIFADSDATNREASSSRRDLVDELLKAELQAAWSVRAGLMKHGVRAQHYIARSNPQQHIDAAADHIGALLGGAS